MLKRLLCLDQFGQPGGGQAILGDLVRGALADGIEVHVALPAGSFAANLGMAGAGVHDLKVPSMHGHRKTAVDAAQLALGVRSLSGDIRRIIADVRPDLMHVNGGRVLLPAALSRPVCPLTFHAHTAYVDRPTLLATRWALKRARCRAVIAPSPFMRKWIHERLGVPPANAKLVWNWVGDGFFAAGEGRVSRPPAESGALRVVVVGRIAPVKGQDVVIAAFRALPAEVRGRWELEISGPVDEETGGLAYLAALEQQSAGEPGTLLRPGRVDALEVIASADLCVVPSLFEETFGLVAAEAMAAGVPVVVSDCGALPDVVGGAGEVVLAGDVADLTEVLAALLPDAGRRGALAELGHRRAQVQFRRDRQVAELLGVLDAVV